MRVSALTLLILQVNSLIDTGKYTDISIADVHRAIEAGRVLRFLADRCGNDIDLSLHVGSDAYGNFEEVYEAEMQDIYGGYGGQERRKWGVKNSGLCMILGWTNEIVQRGQFMASGLKLTWRD